MSMSPLWNMRWASLLQLCGLGLLGTFETVLMKDHGLSGIPNWDSFGLREWFDDLYGVGVGKIGRS